MDKIYAKIKFRTLQYIDFQGIKKEDFYKKTGVAASNFKGNNAKSEFGGEKIVQILHAYPDINSEWLLTGSGPMVKSYSNTEIRAASDNLVHEPITKYKGKNRAIPLIPALAQGGVNGFEVSVSKHEIEHYFDIPILKEKADFALKVTGDSMHPYYENGSYIICKQITINELHWENAYLVLVNHAPMIKRLYPSTNKDHILCRSDNQQYRDFEIAKSDITHIAKILAKITLA